MHDYRKITAIMQQAWRALVSPNSTGPIIQA
jgi:hypothetical protein